MIETETLLEKCPQCGAWPMAAKLPKADPGNREIQLRCVSCGHREGGRFRRAGGIARRSEQAEVRW